MTGCFPTLVVNEFQVFSRYLGRSVKRLPNEIIDIKFNIEVHCQRWFQIHGTHAQIGNTESSIIYNFSTLILLGLCYSSHFLEFIVSFIVYSLFLQPLEINSLGEGVAKQNTFLGGSINIFLELYSHGSSWDFFFVCLFVFLLQYLKRYQNNRG